MKNARLTDEQIVRIPQEADRYPITAVAERHIFRGYNFSGITGKVKSCQSVAMLPVKALATFILKDESTASETGNGSIGFMSIRIVRC